MDASKVSSNMRFLLKTDSEKFSSITKNGLIKISCERH